jgi:acetyl esterase
MTEKLQAVEVEVNTLFFPADYTPELPHEYQFNLDTEAGQLALKRALGFLRKHS